MPQCPYLVYVYVPKRHISQYQSERRVVPSFISLARPACRNFFHSRETRNLFFVVEIIYYVIVAGFQSAFCFVYGHRRICIGSAVQCL